MDEDAIERARERLSAAAAGRPGSSEIEAVLEHTRSRLEALAETAAHLDATLPALVRDAVRDGMRSEALPVARQLAEVRGLAGQTIRRLERLEGDMTTERYSRVDDLGLLVELLVSGWRTVDQRLGRIEQSLHEGSGATVHHLGERLAGA